MNELALFAGAGGGILGGVILGWRTVCAVEYDPYARATLIARQNDGCLEAFPIWDDVRTFDGRPWTGKVDIISGGFPCQDISCAGKGAGISGERSGLWAEFARIIREVRPRYVFVENSPMLTSRGLGTVLGDLAELGFDARWGVLGAVHTGAPHRRLRIWIRAEQRGFVPDSDHARPHDDIRSRRDAVGHGGQDAMADPGQGRQRNDARRQGQPVHDAPKNEDGTGDASFDEVPDAGEDGCDTTLQGESRGSWAEFGITVPSSYIRGTGLRRSICTAGHSEKPGVTEQGGEKDLGDAAQVGCDGWEPSEEARNDGDLVDPLLPGDGLADPGEVGSCIQEEDEELERQRLGVEGDGSRGDEWEPAVGGWWTAEPDLGRVAHGVANRVDRIACLGNGQVPAVVAFAWKILIK